MPEEPPTSRNEPPATAPVLDEIQTARRRVFAAWLAARERARTDNPPSGDNYEDRDRA